MRFTILLICLILAGTSGNLIAQSTKPKASTSKPATTKKPTQTSTKPKASAQKTPSKEGCTSGNCKNGYGTFVYPDTLYTDYWPPRVRKIKYVGNFVDGKREGQGTTYYGGQKEGELAKIEGIWKDDDSFDAVAYDAKNKVLDVIRGGESTSKTKEEAKKQQEKLPCAVYKELETSDSHSTDEYTRRFKYYIYSIQNQDTRETNYIAASYGDYDIDEIASKRWVVVIFKTLEDAKNSVNYGKETLNRGWTGHIGLTNCLTNGAPQNLEELRGNKSPDSMLRFVVRTKLVYGSSCWGCISCNGYIFK